MAICMLCGASSHLISKEIGVCLECIRERAGQALEVNKGRILRICRETNGSMHPGLLDEVTKLALGSGGCIKFTRFHISPSEKRTALHR